MIQVHVKYFAILKEQRGFEEETIITPVVTALELYNHLAQKYKFTLPAERIRAAINDEFVPINNPLKNNDTIVFLPPMAGG